MKIGGAKMTKKKLNKRVIRMIKSHMKEQEQKQVNWQKSVLQQENISFK